MSKGQWRKPICRCSACPKCKDRERKAAARAGRKTKYVPKGRQAEHKAAAARIAKAALKEEKARLKAEREEAKERARGFRARRGAAFKRNVEKFGLKKAKFIANIVS